MTEDGPSENQKWLEAGKFLTDKERRYLSGYEIDHEPQARYRIRQKTVGALNDLFTVGTRMPNEDVKLLFEGAGNISTVDTRSRTDGGENIMPGHEGELSGIVALGCRGYRLNELPPEQFVAQVVRPGIQKGVADSEEVHPTNVVVDLELREVTVHRDVGEMTPLEKFDLGLGLTRDEWQQLAKRLSRELDRESIPIDELPELVETHLIDE